MNDRVTTTGIKDQASIQVLMLVLLISQVFLQGTILWHLLTLERQLSNSIAFGPEVSESSVEAQLDSSPIAGDVSVGLNPPLGDANASLTIVEFSDFNCPYCKQSAQMLRELINNNPGKIRLYYRHAVPEAKIDSFRAAIASECAGKQGHFWEMHDALFDPAPDFSESRLMNIAKTLKLDQSNFTTCLSTEEFKDRVQADFEEAQNLGLLGTPTFFINGRMIVGSQTQENWQTLLNLP